MLSGDIADPPLNQRAAALGLGDAVWPATRTCPGSSSSTATASSAPSTARSSARRHRRDPQPDRRTRRPVRCADDPPTTRPAARRRRPAPRGGARGPLARAARHRPHRRGRGLRLHLARRPPPLPLRVGRDARPVGGVDDARRRSPRRPSGSRSGRSSRRRRSTCRSCSRSSPRPWTRSRAGGWSWASAPAGTRPSSRALGAPFDHRISRFEEAFTIIRTLLQRRRDRLRGRVLHGARGRAAAAARRGPAARRC